MKSGTGNEDGGYSAVAEAERFLATIQEEAAQPIDPRELEMQTILAAEEECLTQILPALMEASQYLSKKMPKAKRKHIQHELAHASEHLYNNFERLRQMFCGDAE